MSSTCEKIDKILYDRNLSRRSLALSINVPPSTLQSIFAHNREIPTDMLLKISDCLGVPITDLLDLESGSGAGSEALKAKPSRRQLLLAFNELSEQGQTKVLEYISDISEKYRK